MLTTAVFYVPISSNFKAHTATNVLMVERCSSKLEQRRHKSNKKGGGGRGGREEQRGDITFAVITYNGRISEGMSDDMHVYVIHKGWRQCLWLCYARVGWWFGRGSHPISII